MLRVPPSFRKALLPRLEWTRMARVPLRDLVMMVLGVASIAMVFVYESAQISDELRRQIILVDYILVAVFVIEWLDSVRTAARPGHYALVHSWKLLGMIPLAWGLGALRFLRLVRLLRLVGMSPTLTAAFQRVAVVARQSHIATIGTIAGTVTLAGSTLVWLAERGSNDSFGAYGQALWWGVVTVTTVGYGDVVPITPIGRTIAAVLMIMGLGTIGLLASTVASVLVRGRDVARLDAPVPARAGALADELGRLAALRDKGTLSDAEFEAAKAKVLGLA